MLSIKKLLVFLFAMECALLGVFAEQILSDDGIVIYPEQFAEGSASVAYESLGMYRGKEWSKSAVQPAFLVALPLGPGRVYAKSWMNFSVNASVFNYPSGLVTNTPAFSSGRKPGNTITVTAGYDYPLPWMDGLLGVNAGYTYYCFPTGNWYALSHTNEAFFGVMADVMLRPRVYAFYDFTLEQVVVEAAFSHRFDLGDFGLDNWIFGFLFKAGFLHAWDYRGPNHVSIPAASWTEPKWENAYAYAQISLELAYRLFENAEVGVNVNYAGNTDGYGNFYGVPANITGRENFIWWGAQVAYSF